MLYAPTNMDDLCARDKMVDEIRSPLNLSEQGQTTYMQLIDSLKKAIQNKKQSNCVLNAKGTMDLMHVVGGEL